MKMKLIAAAAFVVAFAMPAFAASQFWVVQDTATKNCSIVDTRPAINTMKVIGDAYATQALAQTAMKADKSCVTP
jgi:hypothetical protein